MPTLIPPSEEVPEPLLKLLAPPVEYAPPVPDPEPEPANGQIWGSGQSMAPQLIRGVGVRGTVFSVQFQSDEAGTPWTVHRLVNHMRARRNPSVTRTEVKG